MNFPPWMAASCSMYHHHQPHTPKIKVLHVYRPLSSWIFISDSPLWFLVWRTTLKTPQSRPMGPMAKQKINLFSGDSSKYYTPWRQHYRLQLARTIHINSLCTSTQTTISRATFTLPPPLLYISKLHCHPRSQPNPGGNTNCLQFVARCTYCM